MIDDFSTGGASSWPSARGRGGRARPARRVGRPAPARWRAPTPWSTSPPTPTSASAGTHPRRDLEQNVVATHNVLEAMRAAGVAAQLLFSSTGSVYGEADVIPTPEDAPFPVQTSLYGASKAAAEGFIAAYAEGAASRRTVFRFVSILGPALHPRPRHRLRAPSCRPTRTASTSSETARSARATSTSTTASPRSRPGSSTADGFEVFNLGVDDYCTVDESAGWICDRLGLDPSSTTRGGDRGWIGDNPFILLDTSRIRATGWAPRHGIREAVEPTVDYLVEHPWVLDLDDAAEPRDPARRRAESPSLGAGSSGPSGPPALRRRLRWSPSTILEPGRAEALRRVPRRATWRSQPERGRGRRAAGPGGLVIVATPHDALVAGGPGRRRRRSPCARREAGARNADDLALVARGGVGARLRSCASASTTASTPRGCGPRARAPGSLRPGPADAGSLRPRRPARLRATSGAPSGPAPAAASCSTRAST